MIVSRTRRPASSGTPRTPTSTAACHSIWTSGRRRLTEPGIYQLIAGGWCHPDLETAGKGYATPGLACAASLTLVRLSAATGIPGSRRSTQGRHGCRGPAGERGPWRRFDRTVGAQGPTNMPTASSGSGSEAALGPAKAHSGSLMPTLFGAAGAAALGGGIEPSAILTSTIESRQGGGGFQEGCSFCLDGTTAVSRGA
jgi:hypothetical protein